MNAAERVHSYTLASKLGAIANLFKSKFPAAVVDLKPWVVVETDLEENTPRLQKATDHGESESHI